ncbi:MAG: hypothetical protein ACU837_04775 [Gammaproteobacteria bacterium]
MNTAKAISQQLFVLARGAIVGYCILSFTACSGDPVRTTTAVAAYGTDSSAGSGDPPAALRMALNIGSADAEEAAAIRRVAPGANPRAAIGRYLAALQMPSGGPALAQAKVIFVDESAYRLTFPGRLIYVLRFPQWPVALRPPAPLAGNNLFVFEPGKPLRLLVGSRQLQAYFSQTIVPPGGEAAAGRVLATWLTLFAELAQDGMYRFKAPIVESVGKTAAGTFEAKGRIAVEADVGNKGVIIARIVVAANGKLISAHTEQNLKAGIRPICQATKLLDPDPLVRKMAQRDLLVMGQAARDYLLQQRSRASPELQAEIDRLWRQIVLEGR